MSNTPRVLTGHRPTGPRHIGHLVGTLETWVTLQEKFDCYFLIADLHVLTTDFSNPQHIPTNIIEVATDWLAAGIDPARATLVLQSALPEHAVLNTLLGMLVSTARLERVPTYKEQVQQLNLTPSLGLLSYPVLQAADILLYRANFVPVGEDQLPHIELTREIARRLNQLYNFDLPEPQPMLSTTPRLPGIDNRTMHTSYGNAIFLSDTPEETTRKIMQMYTDPTRIHSTDPGHVEGNPVFSYLDVFDPQKEEVEELKAQYRQGKVGDVEVKHRCAARLNTYLAPLRQRRQELAHRPGDVVELLISGSRKAQPIAASTLDAVMQGMGLSLIENHLT
jgi:tryptophanyl-tRNA synthetase